MKMATRPPGRSLYCFSPPVMIATCVIEVVLLVYTIVRYKMTRLGRLVGATLALLAFFQLAEFMVCARGGPTPGGWSRAGFVAITMLPPLGLHLVRLLAGRSVPRAVVSAAYGSGLAFAAVFGLDASVFQSYACGGNYAIFHLQSPIGGLYFGYYYGWLIAGMALGLWASLRASLRRREALLLQVVGYLTLLLPTGIVNDINPQTIAGIPSIMCGFAVVYALLLTFGIAPRTRD